LDKFEFCVSAFVKRFEIFDDLYLLLMKESVLSFEGKNNTTLVYLRSNRWQVLSFKTNQLNISLDDFSICLLGY